MHNLGIFAALSLAAAPAFAGVDPVLLNLVMPDAKVLSGIQVDQSLASPFGQYILSQMQPTDPGYQKFVAVTGFDFKRDLHEILAASSGDSSVNGQNSVVLVRGNFQASLIASAATSNGAAVSQYRGVNIFVSGTDQPSGIALLNSSTAAIGALTAIQPVIDRSLSSAVYSGPLAQKAQSASAASQAWFATTSPLADFLNGKVGNGALGNASQSNLLQSVLQASGGVNFSTTGVTIAGDAVTSSNQNAQALVDVLKFLVSMVQTNNDKAISTLADAATFSANGAIAHMSLSLSEQQAEQLFVIPSGAKSKARKPAGRPAH
jgi:hypothetical protein